MTSCVGGISFLEDRGLVAIETRPYTVHDLRLIERTGLYVSRRSGEGVRDVCLPDPAIRYFDHRPGRHLDLHLPAPAPGLSDPGHRGPGAEGQPAGDPSVE